MSIHGDSSLNGRLAVVTGGARGIGRASALALARRGAALAVLDVDGDGAQATAADARQHKVPARAWTVDVADESAVRDAFAEIRRELGRPDILVSNAGIAGEPTLFRDETKAAWTRMFAVHVDGAFHCLQQTYPAMLEAGWGRIVLISSVAARLGWRGGASYAAAKGALLGLMRTLALEGAARGVTVNAVLPGVIDTEMARAALAKVRDRIEGMIPARRIGAPEEVAHAVAFLCSEEAAYVTGQCLSPNGGLWMP